MEFLVAGFEIIEQEPGINGIYKSSELPGRICYGSQNKMAEGTAEIFCKGLMKSSHGAPLEHGTVYLKVPHNYKYECYNAEFYDNGTVLDKYLHNPYSKVYNTYDCIYVTTNLRVLFENEWMDDLKYLCEPTEYHEKRYTVRFTVDRFTGEEFLRHRKASFNRESTRYVLFTKEKFGNGSIKYIIPTWLLDKIDDINEIKKLSVSDFCESIIKYEKDEIELSDIFVWESALKIAEWAYCTLTNVHGWKAEEARTVLPCAINSPLIKTAFISDWKHFFNLRAKGTTGKPHPQASELAEPLMHEFIKRGYLNSSFLES